MSSTSPRPIWKTIAIALAMVQILMLALAAPALAAPPANSADTPSPDKLTPWKNEIPETGRVIVRFAHDSLHDASRMLLEELSVEVVDTIAALNTAIIEVPAGQEFAVATTLSARPGVLLAEPDAAVYAAMQPNDPDFATYQWNMHLINAPAAWDMPVGESSSVIAIVDTGIDLDHPELAGKIVPGIDMVNNDSVAQDDHAHGTHVAGIAAAVGNNGQGVAGVSWNAQLMPVKILDKDGRGYMSTLAQAIIWATDHGANVINMSVASLSNNQTVQDAIEYAYSRGVVLVAAAGNAYSMGELTIYPAAFNHVIGVGAIGSQSEHASYSSAGPFVDVAAPGGHSNMGPSIYSTFWQNGMHTYNHAEGTSMAAPHVSGLVALLKETDASLTPDEIEQIITGTAVDLGDPGRDHLFGAGRIDAAAALKSVLPYPPATDMTYVEAESGRLLTPMQVQPDANTPSGAFTISSVVGVGTVELRFTLDQPQFVYLWALTSAESASPCSYYVSVDHSADVQWDFSTSNDWTWAPITDAMSGGHQGFALDAGDHSVRFTTRAGSARLDAIAVGGDESMTASNLASEYIQAVAQRMQ